MTSIRSFLHFESIVSDFKSLIDAIYFKGLRTKLGIGILFLKLFLPTAKKKCSYDRENLLKFEAEG